MSHSTLRSMMTPSWRRYGGALVLSAAFICACTHPRSPDQSVRPNRPLALRDAFKDAFRIGAAINENQFSGMDAAGAALVKQQFNTVSPENVLKWEVVHPRLETFDFSRGDKYVAFGESSNMFIIGHCLIWHSQTPAWVFQDANGRPLTRDALLERMHEHIATVVGHYKGRINGWDVVNEALNEDGSMRKSQWYNIIGDDFIVKAFQFAHEADPSAELYYNDYSLENAAKRRGAVALVNKLKAAGVTITAVGSQSHDKMDWPTVAQEDSTITELAATGVKVNISEFDVDVLPPATQSRGADVSLRGTLDPRTNPYANGLPDSVQAALANRYASLFRIFLAHRTVMERVTFWGVGDADSWLNNWPVRGRTSYPLLFDRQDRPTPAFDAVVRVVRPADARR
jgi:endo-1,4-beta-xylanase